MEGSGQPHFLTICAPEKEQKNKLPWPAIELEITVHCPVTTRTTSSWYRNSCVRSLDYPDCMKDGLFGLPGNPDNRRKTPWYGDI